jgi:hypothetical protein
MNEWPIPQISSPLGLIDYVLLVFAILRITHKRIQKLCNPSLTSAFALFFFVALSVSMIAFCVEIILTITTEGAFIIHRGRGAAPGFFFVAVFLGPQVFLLVGIVAGYFAGPSFSRMLRADPPASVDPL